MPPVKNSRRSAAHHSRVGLWNYELQRLADKHKASALMHLKAYQIDRRVLRTGAANFSASGLKRQDNDLVMIESAAAAASFKRNFDARFASGEALRP
jgi:phosphatidylserine/phosphatidylglycerophosphate/cardiolipin synthase-like enzyme